MTFTQPCFIRMNTKELRDYLENLGYMHIFGGDTTKSEGLFIQKPNWYGGFNNEPNWDYDQIEDCGINEELFKSIAALNDENDYMQWFVDYTDPDNLEWVLCNIDNIKDHVWYNNFMHKATVEELIEHFK